MEIPAHLPERLKTGDHAALEELIECHEPALRAFVRLKMGPALRAHESHSDLVQSVCRELLSDLSTFEYRGEAAFRAWMYQAAERKLRDRARYWARDKRDADRAVPLEPGSPSDDGIVACYTAIATPSEFAAANELAERLEAAFDELPERDRHVILLARVVGLSTAEIGAELNENPRYARTLLSRALARLATLLERR